MAHEFDYFGWSVARIFGYRPTDAIECTAFQMQFAMKNEGLGAHIEFVYVSL